MIVEDDVQIAELVSLYLKKEGMDTTLFETAEQALGGLSARGCDLIILDLNLPGMDGFEFLRIVRKEKTIPVLILSSRKADEDMILGLGMGADDFIIKPFSPKVLAARVRAHLRRSFDARNGARTLIRFGPFAFDKDGYVLKRDNERVALSPREFELLAFLLSKPGKVFCGEDIYKNVWENPYGDVTTVAVHIQRLRRKIEIDPLDPYYIRTMHGAGYYFNADGLSGNDHEWSSPV